ncbi:MAG: hypothetical protein JJ974_10850 [Phycisphaerales bacterium]|nr:hypothetical protein [Phycisphaerales bacterium]
MVMQTPWIAYVFLVLLVYCLLSALIEQKRLIGWVQITLAVCIPVVVIFKDAQDYGWEYWMIWIGGVVGCFVYWLERMIDASPLNELED